MKMFALPDSFARIRRQFVFPMNGPDDFMEYTSADIWTSLAADGGVTAPVESDAEWGVVTMATGATDNNEVMVRSTNEVVLFQADGSFAFISSIQFTEANVNDANVAVGLANAAGANLLGDDGAGDNIGSSGVLIFKVDGGTVWRCACENNGTIVEDASEQTAGGASYQELMIIGRPVDGTNYEFTYFLDRQPLTLSSTHKQIKHTLAYASATEMRVVAGYVKAGDTNSETLNIDYCGLVCTRV